MSNLITPATGAAPMCRLVLPRPLRSVREQGGDIELGEEEWGDNELGEEAVVFVASSPPMAPLRPYYYD